jgi:2OG-Fe(II) oxygenase superfamily
MDCNVRHVSSRNSSLARTNVREDEFMSDRQTGSVIRPIDLERIRTQYRSAQPFPFFVIDNFLEENFAKTVLGAYPSYTEAKRMGMEFDAVNERLKVQVTDRSRFPGPVTQLADALSGEKFLGQLEYITGIPKLLSDAEFNGGGMHLTGPSGRLDVHVDFNLLGEKQLHRRLNILVYLNEHWEESWGGSIELWDQEVKHCRHSMQPVFNRCVVFETSEISYHGVAPITCPEGFVRRSFAAYYYTVEAPANWDGSVHSTVFRARPNEKLRGSLLMPGEKFLRLAKDAIRKAVGR